MAAAARRIAAVALAGALGCGGLSGKVLERIDGSAPPSSNLRVDVFLVRSLSSCAVGPPCTSANLDQCFYVTDSNGGRVTFDPSETEFVAPGDPATLGSRPVQCFRLVMGDAAAATAHDRLQALRTRVFQSSGGDINLDIRTHEVPALSAPLLNYYAGFFLRASSVADAALPLVNRETDFVFAVTGAGDPETGLTPRASPCAGATRPVNEVVGGSPYAWIGLTGACLQEETWMSGWLLQFYFGLRDVMQSPVVGGDYPACGQGDPDPTSWFPYADHCTTDPDWRSCGANSCADQAAFNTHALAVHWRRGAPFNGNRCSDGRMDGSETGIDTGGVCDLLGR